MRNDKHHDVRIWLIASLFGSSALIGCGVDAPAENERVAAMTGGPAVVQTQPEGDAPVQGKAATAFTYAEDAGSFGIYLRQGGRAHKVRAVQVAGHVNELTVQAHATPAGDRIAIIPNYDTFAGTELRIVDTALEGTERVLENGRVASAAWSADGKQIAYLAMADGAHAVRISDGAQPGKTIGAFEALRARLLGWSKDNKELYVVIDREQNGGPPLVAFGVVDMATGALRTTFASDSESSTFYRDFQLVEAQDGTQLVSFVQATTLWPCGGTNRLRLATVNGTVLAEHGETADSYSQVRFSADGKQVAYELRSCPDKPQGLEKAQQRMAEMNGIQIAQVGEASSKRIAAGLLRDFRVAEFADGGVELTSPTRGVHVVTAADKLTDLDELEVDPSAPGKDESTSLFAQQLPPANARNNTAQYVHQLWDTPDWFDGNWACGPSSSVMNLAGYQLGTWPMTVSWPYQHTSSYGQYVAVQYTYNGYTFSTSSLDASGHSAKGAYGYIVPNGLAVWNNVTSYLDIHVPWAVQQASGSIGQAWVKQRLNENYLVVASGSVFGYGHLILIRGYTDDGRFYVNDPFGYQVSGNYNGANVIYTWANISPSHFWAA